MSRRILICLLSIGFCFLTGQSMATPTIAPDGLVPNGLKPGDKFYVVFVSSNTVNGAQTAATYQAIAATAAANNSDTEKVSWTTLYGHDDSSLVTTSAFTDTSVPIYNTNGDKVADNRAEFFSNSHDAPIQYNESGVSVGGVNVWTGYNFTGSNTGIGDDSLGGNDSLNDGCLAGRANATDQSMFAAVLSGGAGCAGANHGLYVVSELLQVQPEIDYGAPQLSQSSLTLRVGESADITITGVLPKYRFSTEGSQSVAAVTDTSSGLTVTALEEGSVSVRVYQIVGDSAYLTIEVIPSVEQEILADLERLTEGQNGSDQAVFLGGVKSDIDDRYYKNGKFYVGEGISIDFAISPAEEHIGEAARIVLALQIAGQIFIADGMGSWAAYDGGSLTSYQEVVLEANNLIRLIEDSSTMQLQAADVGSYELFIGYELIATGELIYEGQSLRFEVANQ